MNTSAGLKFPPLARYPMTIGTTMDAKLPVKLKMPPVNPIKCLGDNSETNTQEINAMPAPKKANDMNENDKGCIVNIICANDAAG